jgi:hypothetical protein
MSYDLATSKILQEDGVEMSTMMNAPCLRYKGAFIASVFEKEDCLIIKVSPERVNELIEDGKGMEFNYTKKRFKEWVMIPLEFEEEYELFLHEALDFAKKYKLF